MVPAVRLLHSTAGFVASVSDTSLFVYKEGPNIAYLLLYVDDIVLTASSSALLLHAPGQSTSLT